MGGVVSVERKERANCMAVSPPCTLCGSVAAGHLRDHSQSKTWSSGNRYHSKESEICCRRSYILCLLLYVAAKLCVNTPQLTVGRGTCAAGQLPGGAPHAWMCAAWVPTGSWVRATRCAAPQVPASTQSSCLIQAAFIMAMLISLLLLLVAAGPTGACLPCLIL